MGMCSCIFNWSFGFFVIIIVGIMGVYLVVDFVDGFFNVCEIWKFFMKWLYSFLNVMVYFKYVIGDWKVDYC